MVKDEWKAQYEAPEGAIWVCGACGKKSKNRADVGDESCFINAILVHESPGIDGLYHVWKEEKDGN